MLRFLRGMLAVLSGLAFFLGFFLCLGPAVWMYCDYTQEIARWNNAGGVYDPPADPGEVIAVLMVWGAELLTITTVLLLLRWGIGKLGYVSTRNVGFLLAHGGRNITRAWRRHIPRASGANTAPAARSCPPASARAGLAQ